MDRRSFLTAMFGVAGAAALASAVRPIEAMAGVPGAGHGILDELETPQTEAFDEDSQAEVQQVYHRDWHHRPTAAGGAGDGSAAVTGGMAAVASGATADGDLRSSFDFN